jgi:ribosomal protein S27E
VKLVDKNTRAGQEGRVITCPNCNKSSVVYHFSWSALGCINCKEMIDKNKWQIEQYKEEK